MAWSHTYIRRVRHGGGAFAEIKNDHECPGSGEPCCAFLGCSPYPDAEIRDDLKFYGISGVPVEWRRRILGYTNEQLQERLPRGTNMPIHESTSVADAMDQLDSRIPLTHRELKFVITSLYDLAFREGARQGRQAGAEHVHNQIHEAMADLSVNNPARIILGSLLPVTTETQYQDPTDKIRRNLEEKQRAISQMRNGL